jgi:hypothetical protein
VSRAIVNTPFDDEPLTDEELAAIREAEEDIRAGRFVEREFGVSTGRSDGRQRRSGISNVSS